MAKQQSDAERKFYMKQANIIVDILLEILPPIYYDVFKDDFDLFMRDLWISDGEHEPIFSEQFLKKGETIQTLEQTNWNTLAKEKKMEWLEKFDLQALLKSICFREDSLKLFCKKNALAYYNLKSVFKTMTQWRNYGVGHKSTSKYKEMDKSIFAEIILAPANDLCDQLRREYKQECEILKDTLKDIRIRMKYPETSISRLIYLTNIPEETVREVLKILKVDVGSDETIFGEDEEELVDSIKRLSEKDSVKKNEKDDKPSDLLSKIKNRDKKTIGILAGALLLLLLVIILLAQCGNGGVEKKKSEKSKKVTAEKETTTDNRPKVNPFDYYKVKIKYYNEEDDGELVYNEEYDADYDGSEEESTSSDDLYVTLKYLEEKDKKGQFEGLTFDICSSSTGDKYDKTENGGFVVPNKEKVSIKLSDGTKDDYNEYNFTPDSMETIVEGDPLVRKISDIGSYKGKRLKKLRKIAYSYVKSDELSKSDETYVGFYFVKQIPDMEHEKEEPKVILYLVYKAKDHYHLQGGWCYYALKIDDPIIKSNYITYSKIIKTDDLEFYYPDDGYTESFGEKGLYNGCKREGYTITPKGKLKKY